ncbi:MAG: type VII secretion protein EssC [Lachnospiraceae bacterium]|nr:type VII secretion protein EssC [Lachnospiraceae bacterium]
MFVLSIYINEFYKELRLPVLSDSDYSVVLHKSQFDLKKDIELVFETIGNQWVLKESTDYKLFKDGNTLEQTQLSNNDVLQIYTINRENLTLIARDVPHAPAVYDKYDISTLQEITIGKKQDMDICYDFLGLVSREHATITRTAEGWKIFNKGQNGLYVNSKHVVDETILAFGDHIIILGLNLVFLGELIAIDNSQQNVLINTAKLAPYVPAVIEPDTDQELLFSDPRILVHRAPRNIIKIDKTPIEIEPVPAKNEQKQQSLLQTVGSSLTMSLPMLLCGILMVYNSKQNGGGGNSFMFTGIIMSVSSALLGIMWTIVNRISQKKQEKKDDLHRFDAYSKYLIETTDIIRQKYNNNMNAMHTMYKSAQECTTYDAASGLLWNRNSRHEDFLFYRLGVGNIPFQANIAIPKEGFTLQAEDSLLKKPAIIKENFDTLYNVPVGVDLMKHKMLGLVGGQDYMGAVSVVKLLAAQIAANNSYTDVKMVFVYNSNSYYNIDQWEFAKWLPHVWSEDKKVRYVASNQQEAGDLFFDLARVFRQREEMEGVKEDAVPYPYYVMFVMNPEMLEGELIAKYVYDNSPKHGLTTVIVSDSYDNLPNECEYMVENDENFTGKYSVSQEEDVQLHINFDQIADDALETFARRMANYYIRENETGGDIPVSLSFFDMYGVSRLSELNVIDRWRKNRVYDNIRGFLGQKAGGNLCYLDVHEKYHGPHGLVAGTTGSGKSETLQTYMLSLAVNYSPDDVGFFVIDYKGGGMANLFNGLPHLIGQISNLSGNQVRRAMVSIKSENRRRQTIFNESGVNNINLYTKLYKNNEASVPVPHLFIIIDEFAELKREEPDFMRELISVAQVGRSLGVHLILATQKPNGTVDDNIWSNTKFRLCLRVADKQDSQDMLHKPDAAFISQAGRCYLQVGNDEIFELFQSGYSGATYQEEDDGNTDVAKLVNLTGKVDMTGNFTKTAQKEKSMYKWAKCLEGIVANAMVRQNTYIENCVESKARMDGVIEEIYVCFEEAGIDYAASAYNSARLADYITTYYAAMKLEGDTVKNLLDIAASNKIKLPQEKEKTQLDAVKEYLAEVARKNGYNHKLQLWMPVLPSHLYLDNIAGGTEGFYKDGSWSQHSGEWSLDIVMGLMDDPQNQDQIPLKLSFSEGGHHAVCGMVTTGRSTSVQTIAYALINKYAPSYVNIYGIDFSSKMLSAFEAAPHVGDIVYEGEYEKIAKLFKMLNGILEDRKKLLKGGNYKQYVQVNGVKLPAIVVIIDNFGAFNEKTEEKYLQSVITLSKEGVSNGIYLLLTGTGFSSSEIPGKIGENIKTGITTEMTEKYAYADILHSYSIDVLPETGIKGRGLVAYGKRVLEYQTALGVEAQDDYERLGKITALCEEMSSAWTGRRARPIPVIPEKPVWSGLSASEDFEIAVSDKNLLPVGYNGEDASVYSIDLRKTYCYLITGLARSGKKNFLRVVIQSILKKDADLCIIDGPSKLMESYSAEEAVTYVDDEEKMFNFFSELLPEFKRRNQIKRELLAQDLEQDELYEIMSKEKPKFIVISDMQWYIKTAYEGKNIINGFLENITEKGKLHNIYFIGMIGLDKVGEVDFRKLFKLFNAGKTGIHFGGNPGANKLFNFELIPYREQNKPEKAGTGLTSSEMGDRIDRVVVPLARR